MVWKLATPSKGLGRNTNVSIGNRTVVFAGHGALNTKTDTSPNDWFVVPQGVTLVFWCLHGNPFAGTALDRRMHLGDFHPQEFNSSSPTQDAHSPSGEGPSFQMGAHRGLPERLKAGERCRNYRLTPPTGLTLGNREGDTRFITVKDRGNSGIGHLLSDLLEQHKSICRNATVHWAACRVVKNR